MALSETFDTATPAGGDSPTEADDRIREVKAAIQEFMDDHNGGDEEGDHYWPLDGTEITDVDVGQHRKITLRQLSDDPSTLASYATITDLGFLYQKDVAGNTELFWQDEAGNVVQMTKAGDLHSSAGFTMLSGEVATIEIIQAVDSSGVVIKNDAGSTGLLVGDDGTVTLSTGSRLAGPAAPGEDAGIANRKYVDDQIDDVARLGVWNDRDADGSGDSVSKDTEYTAATDGFVVAKIEATGGAELIIDLQSPTGTSRAKEVKKFAGVTQGDIISATIPVRKGDTWKVVTTGSGGASTTTVFWMPLGTD